MVPQTYISLFSGVGGGDLACQWLLRWQCVCYVEIDEYCQRVLRQRIADGWTAFGVDQDDPTNYVVDSKVVMLLIRDVNRDGRVTTADYSAVKEGLGAVAPNPVDYGG